MFLYHCLIASFLQLLLTVTDPSEVSVSHSTVSIGVSRVLLEICSIINEKGKVLLKNNLHFLKGDRFLSFQDRSSVDEQGLGRWKRRKLEFFGVERCLSRFNRGVHSSYCADRFVRLT